MLIRGHGIASGVSCSTNVERILVDFALTDQYNIYQCVVRTRIISIFEGVTYALYNTFHMVYSI